MSLAFFTGGTPGIGEILIIAAVLVLLFGAKKLPELSRSIGKSLGEFKRGKQEGDRAVQELKKEVLDNEESKSEANETDEKDSAEPETKP